MKSFDDINEMIWAFQKARLLLTAVELDVFSAVAGGAENSEVAAKCDTHSRSTEMLLNALVAEGFLEKEGAVYRNTSLSRRYLMEGSPEDGRAALLHHAGLWPAWSQLTTCVREGAKADVPRRDKKANRAFIGAMHVYAAEQAAYFVNALELGGVDSLLDLGGGSGAYAIAFCQAHRDLRATLFDREDILPITGSYIDEAGLSERIALRSGDLLTDDLGGPYQVVWVSNVLHGYGPENIGRAFQNIYQALRPGGTLIFRDFIMDDTKTEPAFAALFALNMLVTTGEGGSYSQDEYARWIRNAGFDEPELKVVDHPGATRLLLARKN